MSVDSVLMLLAYDFPLLSVMISMAWFLLWLMWISTVFRVIGDIFQSRDLSGVSKTLWMVLVMFLPFLGVFAYVASRGDAMALRAFEAQQARDAAAQDYTRQAAGSANVADQMAQLNAMRADGSITDADYEAAKTKVLAA